MMLITAALSLILIGALIRDLQNGWYVAHSLAVCAAVWVLSIYYPVPVFSRQAFLALLIFHLPLINITTFAAYAYDKRAAKQSRYRVPERTLHALALIGGTPMAFVARRVLRHKTRKTSFLTRAWLVFVVQIWAVGGLAVWLLSGQP
jgi:uncharacterized membrane protein YsdA (DUF1294 family)